MTGISHGKRPVVARLHTATAMHNLLQRFQWEVLDHSPYSTDLTPSDYHLFGPLRKHLGSQNFRNDAETQEAVLTWLHNLDADFFDAGFDGFVYRWNKYLDRHGDYVGKCAHVPSYIVYIYCWTIAKDGSQIAM